MSVTLTERPIINNQRCNLLLRSPIDKDETDNENAPIRIEATEQSASTSNSSNIWISLDMSNEENRLKSFESVQWPHDFIQPRILAKTGFYSVGRDDEVKCFFCKVVVKKWEIGDNEVGEHLRWSPNCPLLKRRRTNNKPIEPITELDQLLPPKTYDVCGSLGFNGLEIRNGAFAESQLEMNDFDDLEPITLKNIKYPQYSVETDRVKTFDEWPKCMKQTPLIMADAGFFYSGQGDRVICFSCGGRLKEWDDEYIPWEHHALWFPKCDYVRLVKGQEYIESVKSKYPNISGIDSVNTVATETAKNTKSIAFTQTIAATPNDDDQLFKANDSKLCKICYTNEYNTVFVPCGHIVACGKCASSVTACPLCRKRYDNVMRIFFS